MKYTLNTLLLVLVFNLLNAQGIVFFEGDLSAAKEKATKENKLIFIDAYTTWCGPCKWMAKNTFTDKNVGEMFNAQFIPFKLDMEKGEGLDFAKEYNVSVYPTLLFIDNEGKLMHKRVGALNVEQLLNTAKTSLDPDARIGGLIQKYEAGERGNAFIQKYLKVCSGANIDVIKVSDAYFMDKSDKDLMTKENVGLIIDLVRIPNHNGFQFLLNNQEACQQLAEIELNRYFDLVYTDALAGAHRESDAAYDRAVSDMEKSGYHNADGLQAKMEISNLQHAETPDWVLITEKANQYFTKFAPQDWGMRNEMAWEYFVNDNINDEKLLKSALKWVEESVEIKALYMNVDTHAAILYKLKMKDDAIKAANRAIKLAEESGDDTTETKELLDMINKL